MIEISGALSMTIVSSSVKTTVRPCSSTTTVLSLLLTALLSTTSGSVVSARRSGSFVFLISSLKLIRTSFGTCYVGILNRGITVRRRIDHIKRIFGVRQPLGFLQVLAAEFGLKHARIIHIVH